MDLLLPGIASAYLITFARVGTLIMLMPGVGEQTVPPRLRLAFALLVALVLFPMVRPLLGGTEGVGGPRLVRAAVRRDDHRAGARALGADGGWPRFRRRG